MRAFPLLPMAAATLATLLIATPASAHRAAASPCAHQ